MNTFHTTSFKGIFDILKSRRKNYRIPLYISLIFSISIILIINYGNLNSYEIVTNLANNSISIFSSLLGFSLGGYALIIGFSNNELIEKTSKADNYSTYQILSGFFAFTLIIQLITLSIGFIIKIISDLKIKVNVDLFNSLFIQTINYFFILLLLFLSVYSILLCLFIVTNLFTLGQLNNFYYTLEKRKKDIEANTKKKEN